MICINDDMVAYRILGRHMYPRIEKDTIRNLYEITEEW
jgi:hypothetical protein